MSMQHLGHIYTKKLCAICLNFEFIWASCIERQPSISQNDLYLAGKGFTLLLISQVVKTPHSRPWAEPSNPFLGRQTLNADGPQCLGLEMGLRVRQEEWLVPACTYLRPLCAWAQTHMRLYFLQLEGPVEDFLFFLQNILIDSWQNEDSLCGLVTCS
jgi:hypothetical protein